MTTLFFLTSILALFTLAQGALIHSEAPCKDWCGAFCLDSCLSTLATPICLGERCQCLCPTKKADCNETWCNSHCKEKAQTRTFEAHCEEDNKVCKCEYEQKALPAQFRSKLLPANITYVADETLLRAEFKCTTQFCDNYCTKRGEGRKFRANCDATQSCHCFYDQELPPMKALLSKMTTSSFKCTNEWCSKYCDSKSDGRKFDAACDENQTCKCQYARQTFIKASGGPDRQVGSGTSSFLPLSLSSSSSSHSSSNKKFECTQDWCNGYCEGKSSGRKFTASCGSDQACKCDFAWQPTEKRVFSTGSTSN